MNTARRWRIPALRACALAALLAARLCVAADAPEYSPQEDTDPAVVAHPKPFHTGTPFVDDAVVGYMFRTASFNRSSAGDPDVPGLAFKQTGAGVGGWLYGTTGEIANFLSFGATYNFVAPIWAPEQYPFNFILKDPDQQGYGVFGELNARIRWDSNLLVLGRQTVRNQWFMDGVYRFFNKLDQSMVGPRDIRGMNWLTYEGGSLQGRAFDDSLRYYGGYVTDIKQVNTNDFMNLFQGTFGVFTYPVSARTGDTNGMGYIGANWKPDANSMVSSNFASAQNMLNMLYLDYDHVFRMDEGKYLRVGVQWMHQDGNGQNLITGGRNFHANMGGLYLEGRPVPWWIPYGMFGITSDNNQIYSPFSIGPSYLIQRVGENSLAGEHTWILGTTIDFATFGAQGLSFDTTYGQRSNRSVNGNPSLPIANWNEVATDLIYVVPFEGFFRNLRFRARYAKVWQKGDNWNASAGVIQYVDYTTNDVRFDVQLNIPFN